jgi:hypothetical protein
MSSATWKRVLAGALGVLGLLAGVMATVYAVEGFEDFRDPAVSVPGTILFELVMCSMAFAALTIGIRLMRFSVSGRSDRGWGRVKAVLLGIGCFFPAFLLSAPLAILWAEHTWPGDRQSDFVALKVSCSVAMATAIVCCIVLFRKSSAKVRG